MELLHLQLIAGSAVNCIDLAAHGKLSSHGLLWDRDRQVNDALGIVQRPHPQNLDLAVSGSRHIQLVERDLASAHQCDHRSHGKAGYLKPH